MSEWARIGLADVSGGKGTYGLVASAVDGGDHRFLRTTDMITGTIDWDSVPASDAPELKRSKYLLADGDIVISRTGANAGAVAYISNPPRQSVYAGYLVRFRVDPNVADSRFVYYQLAGEKWRKYVEGARTGSAQPQLNAVRMGGFELDLPPLDEQRRIAGVLGAFDDLIETNEQLAAGQASLSRSAWADGASRNGLMQKFGEIAELRRSKASEPADSPYLGLEHFATGAKGLIGHGVLGDTSSQQYSFAAGDVLYGRLRPYFRKVARPGFSGACSGEIWVLRPRAGVPASLVDAIAASQEFTDFANSGSEGTKMPRAKWDHVASFPVCVPDSDTRVRLDELGEALWRSEVALLEEAAQLRRTRDELLPLLMSGRVRVLDVEAVAP